MTPFNYFFKWSPCAKVLNISQNQKKFQLPFINLVYRDIIAPPQNCSNYKQVQYSALSGAIGEMNAAAPENNLSDNNIALAELTESEEILYNNSMFLFTPSFSISASNMNILVKSVSDGNIVLVEVQVRYTVFVIEMQSCTGT